MKLLCVTSLLLCSLSWAQAADFKHFPVLSGRPDSSRGNNRGAPIPVAPPGNRARVLERNNEDVLIDLSNDFSDGDEDVAPARFTPTTERTRINRNRSRNRSRTRIVTSEKKVETTPKPVRQRTRIRTPSPRLEVSNRRPRPTVELATFTTIGLKEVTTKAAPVEVFRDFLDDKNAGNQKINVFLQNNENSTTEFETQTLAPALSFNQETVKKTFSQSLTGLFNPAASPGAGQGQLLTQTLKPQPLRVITDNQPFTFQSQPELSQELQTFPVQQSKDKPFQDSAIRSQPFQTQSINAIKDQDQSIRQQPFQAQQIRQQQFQAKPIQQQAFQAQPIRQEQFQAKPIQQQSFQSQPIRIQPFQDKTIKEQEFQPQQAIKPQSFQAQPIRTPARQQLSQPNSNTIPQAATSSSFQERPSLFTIPIEIPQPEEGTGASFSYSAIIG